MAITLIDILTREIAETKHYYVCQLAHITPTIRCNCGYWLINIEHDKVEYVNRHGKAFLYAADPHFFEKLKKLINELHRRQQRSQAAFHKKPLRR